MERTYWHKQVAGKPLFPDLLWSRPENRAHAGKLLIIGGNLYSFSAPADAFAGAGKAGVGTARVLLPDALQKTVGRVFAAGEYAPSTPSGSFSQQALTEMISLAGWADAVLVAGDLGKNSETAVLLEKFIGKYTAQLTLAKDAADYFLNNSAVVLGRPETTLVLDISQLQKLAVGAKFRTAFTHDMDFLLLIDALRAFSEEYAAHIVLARDNQVFVAVQGHVSTTQQSQPPSLTQIAAHVSVWWLQNPSKPFEALTTAVHAIQVSV